MQEGSVLGCAFFLLGHFAHGRDIHSNQGPLVQTADLRLESVEQRSRPFEA